MNKKDGDYLEKEVFDSVNPKHYHNGVIECIEAMEAAYGLNAVVDFCKCNAFKYLWRFENKNGDEDLKKCQWYIEKYRQLIKKRKEPLTDDYYGVFMPTVSNDVK